MNSPIYLLLDTCILKSLVYKTGINKDLLLLKFWADSGFVKILSPEILREEWVKHREVEILNIKKSVEKEIGILKSNTNIPNHFINELNSNKGETILKEKIEIIDNLLLNSIEKYTTNESIKAQLMDYQRMGIAPFHNGKGVKNINDAYIIYSTLDYINTKQIPTFYFVSSNKDDFSSIDNSKKLHTDFLKKYEDIEINYHLDIHDTINSIGSKLPPMPTDANYRAYPNFEKINIDKSKPILDQLYFLLSSIFSNINYVPNSILVSNYPFKNEDSFSPYYDEFTLTTDNEELFDFFENIDVIKNSICVRNSKFFDNIWIDCGQSVSLTGALRSFSARGDILSGIVKSVFSGWKKATRRLCQKSGNVGAIPCGCPNPQQIIILITNQMQNQPVNRKTQGIIQV